MKDAETASKYGRTTDRKAEAPAKLAAAMNGMRGRQQLIAAAALASAPALASRVLRVVEE